MLYSSSNCIPQRSVRQLEGGSPEVGRSAELTGGWVGQVVAGDKTPRAFCVTIRETDDSLMIGEA